MTQQPQTPAHPILRCATDIAGALKGVRDVQPAFMSPAEKQAAVVELTRAAAVLEELRLRVLATCDDLVDPAAARDVGSWAATVTLSDRGAARADARLAAALDHRWHTVAASMWDGVVNPGQARVVVDALEALPDDLDPTKLPEHGGDATTVIVNIDYDALVKDLGTAELLSGDPAGTDLSASEVRRLACTAKIIPAVLGGPSEVLDLGRSRRLFTPAQRKAIRLRDRRCRAEGCEIPARWTEAHHLKPWSEGGATDLANAISLCNWHHHRIHDHRYTHNELPTGDLRFHRRT